MRNDLNMNPGRAIAQGSHAANAFINAYGKNKKVKEWQNSTTQAFGTVLVLSANLAEIFKINELLLNTDIPNEYIDDPTYGYTVSYEIARIIPSSSDSADRQVLDKNQTRIFRVETTCSYIFGTKEELKPFIGHLPLYP